MAAGWRRIREALLNADYDLLLAGAGHAHLGVLRQWLDTPRPPGRIGLINDSAHAWYSGMLPGLLAGRYRGEQCRVPLQGLCAGSTVELLEGHLIGLDAEANTLSLSDGRRLTAAWLSLNLGSQPGGPKLQDSCLQLLPVKPFEAFLATWNQWCEAPEALAIVGGGAAGVELALALAPQVPGLTLISAASILAGHPPGLRTRAIRRLMRAGVHLLEGVAIDSAQGHDLKLGADTVWQGRRVILATGANPLPWLCEAGLACDTRGFIRVGPTLQSLSHPRIFASGDCASLEGTPRNGVYAVRQGPVLAGNLVAALKRQPLTDYVPQRRALALLADGQGGGLLSWAGMTAEGSWLGWWKDRLDRRFIKRHLTRD